MPDANVPGYAGESCGGMDALFPQAQAILEGPPVPVANRCLADAVEVLKVRYHVEQEPVLGAPGEPSAGFPLLERASPAPLTSAICHTPLIMPGGDRVNATFDSTWTRRCDLAPPDSRYAVSGFTVGGDSHLNFFGFTFQGVHSFGFCLDHTKSMPVGAYNNISMEQAMPGKVQTVRLAVSFCIGNAPTAPEDLEGGIEFFEMLGLNTCPGLNGYDAFGVIQATIWCLLGQGDPANIRYRIDPDCPVPAAADKFPCLEAAIDALYNMAFSFAYGTLDCGEGGLPGGAANAPSGVQGNCCCGNCASSCGPGPGGEGRCNDAGGLRLGRQLGKVLCCNTGTANTDQSDTYLIFTGCANDIRECCGRVLLGPFKLASSSQGTPAISLVPCDGCQGADITLTDYCCNILAVPPTIGQEFYITFRPPCCRYCFDLCAEMETTAIAVYYFRRPNTNALQPIGAPLEFRENRRACIHICIDITPEPPPPEPEPWWEHILVNNNNNNNNNDNNDSNSNNSSLLNNLLENLLSSMMNGSTLGGLPGNNGPGPFPPGPGPFPPGPFPPGPFPPGPFPPPPGPFPEPCFMPFPYIPEPNLILQPTIPTYQAVPMPVPCYSPPPWPAYPQPAPQPPPPYPQPWPQYPQYQPGDEGSAQQAVQQVTVVIPEPQPMPLLLPEFSSAPRPDFSPFETAADEPQIDFFDQFYRDWYGQ